MKRYLLATLFMLALLLHAACQTPQTTIVTREIITNVMVSVTATPEPTEEPEFLGSGGQYIAFTSEGDNGYSGIFLIDPVAKEPFNLTTTSIGTGLRYAPGILRWSPDGSKIAYIAQDSNEKNIFMIDWDSGEPSPLLANPANITAFDWSPDGDQIAFLATSPDASEGSLFLADMDSNLTELATQDDFRVVIAPIVDWSTSDQILVSAHVWAEENFPLRTVQFFLVSAANGDLNQISDERFEHIWGDFSPDGSHILFFSYDEERDYDLFLMNNNGDKVQQLTSDRVFDPAWSPDSSKIAFAYNGSISIIEAHERNSAVAIVNMFDTRAPSWSPDGQWIAFAGKSKENSFFQLYIIRPDGTELTLLTNAEQHHDVPVWQP